MDSNAKAQLQCRGCISVVTGQPLCQSADERIEQPDLRHGWMEQQQNAVTAVNTLHLVGVYFGVGHTLIEEPVEDGAESQAVKVGAPLAIEALHVDREHTPMHWFSAHVPTASYYPQTEE